MTDTARPAHRGPLSIALVLDVDGALSPVCADDPRSDHARWWPDAARADLHLPVWFAPALIAELNVLTSHPDVRPHFLTTWGEDAVVSVAPALGLRAESWPVLDATGGIEAKADQVAELCASGLYSTVIWVDDQIDTWWSDTLDETGQAPQLGTDRTRLITICPAKQSGLMPEHLMLLTDTIHREASRLRLVNEHRTAEAEANNAYRFEPESPAPLEVVADQDPAAAEPAHDRPEAPSPAEIARPARPLSFVPPKISAEEEHAIYGGSAQRATSSSAKIDGVRFSRRALETAAMNHVDLEDLALAFNDPEEEYPGTGVSILCARGEYVVIADPTDATIISFLPRAAALRDGLISPAQGVRKMKGGGPARSVPSTVPEFLVRLREHGFVIEQTTKHHHFTHPTCPGLKGTLPTSPSDRRWALNNAATIRRDFGIDIRDEPGSTDPGHPEAS